MSKVRLVNRMAQPLPVLLVEKDDPKQLGQIFIPKKGSKIVTESELSPHCQSLFNKGLLDIIKLDSVKTEKQLKVNSPANLKGPEPSKPAVEKAPVRASAPAAKSTQSKASKAKPKSAKRR